MIVQTVDIMVCKYIYIVHTHSLSPLSILSFITFNVMHRYSKVYYELYIYYYILSSSLIVGAIPIALVRGRALARIWPLTEAKWLSPSPSRPLANTFWRERMYQDEDAKDWANKTIKRRAESAIAEEKVAEM